jgi:FtsH-binding integral membrane protein
MPWYVYLAAFFAGAFLANVVPHFTYGISGNRFPTPFAHPPGRGLSSPTVNVMWALVNLVVGYVLFRVGNVASQETATLIVFLAGIVFISTALSFSFRQKMSQ